MSGFNALYGNRVEGGGPASRTTSRSPGAVAGWCRDETEFALPREPSRSCRPARALSVSRATPRNPSLWFTASLGASLGRNVSEPTGDRLETDTGRADGDPEDCAQQQGPRTRLAQLRELERQTYPRQGQGDQERADHWQYRMP